MELKNIFFWKKLDRQKIAQKYLKGRGIEIGAFNNPLKVPENTEVIYLDKFIETEKHNANIVNIDSVKIDILDNGESLEALRDSSVDFIIANHFLEHCLDPIGTIKNMFRVVRKNGILFIAIPDKRYTFDSVRDVTPLDHLILDHEGGGEKSMEYHYYDWVRKLTEKSITEDDIHKEVMELMAMKYSIHFHVWTQVQMIEFFSYLKKKLEFKIELVFKTGNEVIFILRKNYSG